MCVAVDYSESDSIAFRKIFPEDSKSLLSLGDFAENSANLELSKFKADFGSV